MLIYWLVKLHDVHNLYLMVQQNKQKDIYIHKIKRTQQNNINVECR